MNGYSGNTFRAVKADGSWHYLKFVESSSLMSNYSSNFNRNRISAISDQGIRNNTLAEAITQSGANADFGVTDLYDAIEAGNYPSWTVYFQVMTPSEAEKFKCTSLFHHYSD
jgi:catalase